MLLDKACTDWLGSTPVFYNEVTGAISHSINDVIDYGNIEIDPEGLRNYLRFGYSVFGHTMVKNVHFLECCSTIEHDGLGRVKITKNDDDFERVYSPGKNNSKEIFDRICEEVEKKIECFDGEIVLPLSGGNDSKLLAYSAKDNRKVSTYSYGLSANQRDSFEVVRACQVAEKCGLKWECIELDSFLKDEYLSEWYRIYGSSVHLHGMYQMEYYNKILGERRKVNENPSNMLLLSGIIGDAWAGAVRIPPINNVNDLKVLGYTHGMSIEDDICLLKSGNNLQEQFWETKAHELEDENVRIVYSMRIKLMLLNYLMRTPREKGFSVWSPFLNPEIAIGMLNLDWKEKEHRVWQNREFEKLGLNFGWQKSKCDYNIVLDIETLRKCRVAPLDESVLREVIKPEFVADVNRQLARNPLKVIPAKPRTVQNMYNKFVKKYNSRINEALIRYEILSPVERLLKCRR